MGRKSTGEYPLNNAGEEWRPVEEFDGRYEVSSLGRVRRAKAARGATVGAILRTRDNWGGYTSVVLSDRIKGGTRSVHTLVAKAFIGPCPEGYEVNHIDRDRHNSRADNLEYVTRRDNILHSVELGIQYGKSLPGESNPAAKLTALQVAEIRAQFQPGIVTRAYLAQRFGVSVHTIAAIVRGRLWRG